MELIVLVSVCVVFIGGIVGAAVMDWRRGNAYAEYWCRKRDVD